MYSEGQPTEETKRAYAQFNVDERRDSGMGAMNGQGEAMRAFEHEENLSVIRETLYSGKFRRAPRYIMTLDELSD